ncbi:MAG: hypothetical protein WBK91_00035 [Alphaproteobacteria bacterium]
MPASSILSRFLLVALCAAVPQALHAADLSQDEITFDATRAVDLNDDNRAAGSEIESQQNLAASSNSTLNVDGDLTTGKISIGSNFGGAGFGSYVNNTGNNSAINSAMSVNVIFQAQP